MNSSAQAFSSSFHSVTKRHRLIARLDMLPSADLLNGIQILDQNDVNLLTTSISNAVNEAPDAATQYAFMLPTAVVGSTWCQLAGIGSSALFSPIFLLVFPLLDIPLQSSGAAIASALLTECFGFASGLTGYSRRGLVDWNIVLQFAAVAVPFSLVGALSAQYLASDVLLLRSVYALFMLSLATYLIVTPPAKTIEEIALESEECEIPDSFSEMRQTQARDGTVYTYFPPRKGSLKSAGATASGGILTGLIGVGIGEVILPQLLKKCCMPLPIAAGTSVAIVIVTAVTAAVIQFVSLAASTGGDVVSVIPWNLVQYTVPGVLVGGQIAPFLAARGTFSDEQLEQFAATLFSVVGGAFAVKAITG
jgi:uncharacterized membrane protein YfcA